jgi:predicted phage terminase large subunit-like protein
VRNTLQAQAGLPVQVADDSSAANRWDTTAWRWHGHRRRRRPHHRQGRRLLLVDDPVKNAEEADSHHPRAHWAWWTSTAYTRLEPGGSALVIMTRWHEDDLAGRLLAKAKTKEHGLPWEVLELPALAAEGDHLGRPVGAALWPERYDEKALADIREDVEARAWNSLYQQHPTPDEGAMYLREWFRYWRHPWEPEPANEKDRARCVVLPKHFQEVFQSWDLALKNTEGSDLVAGGKFGCNGAGRYLLDLIWKRLSFTESLEAMVTLARQAPTGLATLVEDAANGPAAVSSLRTQLPGIIAIRPNGSKRARTAAVTPIVRAGQFFIPYYAPWRLELEEHLVGFPFAAHDDAADCISQALNHAKHREYPALSDEAPVEGTKAWQAAQLERLQRRDAEETAGW